MSILILIVLMLVLAFYGFWTALLVLGALALGFVVGVACHRPNVRYPWARPLY